MSIIDQIRAFMRERRDLEGMSEREGLIWLIADCLAKTRPESAEQFYRFVRDSLARMEHALDVAAQTETGLDGAYLLMQGFPEPREPWIGLTLKDAFPAPESPVLTETNELMRRDQQSQAALDSVIDRQGPRRRG